MRAGLLNVAGTQVGVGLMILTVAIGLTSIVTVVGHWFEWIKLAGAVYLVILGIQLFRSARNATVASHVKAPRTGFFVQQIAILGGTAMVLAALSDSAYALISGRVAGQIDAKRVRAASRIGGVFLIGGGLWLALSRSKP